MKTTTLIFLTMIAMALITFAVHIELEATRLERDIETMQTILDYEELTPTEAER